MNKFTKLLAALFWLLSVCAAGAVTLLPNGKQQFIDGNGNPIVGGQVYMYVVGTTTPKNTWQDAAGSVLNSNPITLDASGYAIIYGSGSYRQVVKDSLGNTIWDQQTADTSSSSGVSWAGAGGGTANAQSITASSFTQSDGQIIYYRPTLTNTSAMTLAVNGSSPIAVYIDTDGGASSLLQGGEVASSTIVGVAYSATDGFFHLITNNFHALNSPSTIAAAATTNIGSLASNIVSITGASTISSFGSSASKSQALYVVTFTGINTITYNATSMITPTGQSIVTNAGDSALLVYLGSGNWQVYSYFSSSGAGANNQTGTTYTVASTDRGKVITLTNAAAITVTVPQATGTFGSGFYFTLSNIGSTWVTVNFTTSTFAGLSTTSIPPYTSLQLMSDGTNWAPQASILTQSGRFLLNTITFSSSTPQDTTSFLLPYNEFEIELLNFSYGGSALIQVQASAAFQTTSYISQGLYQAAAGGGQMNTTSGIQLSRYTTGGSMVCNVRVSNPSSTNAYKTFLAGSCLDSAAVVNVTEAVGYWSGGFAAVTGFQLAGTNSGTIKVYGWR